jgi:hypothetical protein
LKFTLNNDHTHQLDIKYQCTSLFFFTRVGVLGACWDSCCTIAQHQSVKRDKIGNESNTFRFNGDGEGWISANPTRSAAAAREARPSMFYVDVKLGQLAWMITVQ